jgi:uncharacterized membrane protein YphA (DoxX/SURF4 family)
MVSPPGRRPDIRYSPVNSRSVTLLILRLALGAIFIYAAIGKITDPGRFAGDIAAYRLLPVFTVNILAMVLPYIEILTGLGLIIGVWVDAAGAIASVLLTIFLIAALSAMARGLNIECGCFTLSGAGKVGWDLIARDILMLTTAIVVFLYTGRHKRQCTS